MLLAKRVVNLKRLKKFPRGMFKTFRYFIYTDKGVYISNQAETVRLGEGTFILITEETKVEKDLKVFSVLCVDILSMCSVKVLGSFPIALRAGETVAFGFEVPRYEVSNGKTF